MSKSKKSKKTSKSIVGISVIVLMLLGFLMAVAYITILAGTSRDKTTLTVGDGDTYYSLLADKAWQTHALGSGVITRMYLKFYATKPLQKGNYDIPKGASLAQVVNILQNGAKPDMIKVQIIEGKTVKDLYYTLKTTEGIELELLTPLSQDGKYSWIDVTKDNASVANALDIKSPNGNLEGQFSPNTYFFNQGTSDRVILQKLYHDQQEILDKAWAARADNLPYKTPYEALIMASIIEKETGIKSERNDVSAVFVNRLRQGMRLQTDPTIIYGLFDRYDGKIYKSNIAEKTDYNTYQIDGLPPTPIALPSAEAIQATMHPSDVPYIYFVATGNGGHKFSVTLDEHNKAVAAYRAVMADK